MLSDSAPLGKNVVGLKLAPLLLHHGVLKVPELAGPQTLSVTRAEGTAAFNPCAGAVTQGAARKAGHASVLPCDPRGFMAGKPHGPPAL